jgi:hypothetical protein
MEKRQRVEPVKQLPIDLSPTSLSVDGLNEIENLELNEAYNNLSQPQLIAARMESSGIRDRGIIAQHCNVNPVTITNWRNDPFYNKIIELNTKILERINKKFREDNVKVIIAPGYAEIIRRVHDIDYIKNVDLKVLIDLLSKLNRETRMDSFIPTGDDKSKAEDLIDLQNRRRLMIENKKEKDTMQVDARIIEFPKQAVA